MGDETSVNSFVIIGESGEEVLGRLAERLKKIVQFEKKSKTVCFSLFKIQGGQETEISIRSCEKILNRFGWEITIHGDRKGRRIWWQTVINHLVYCTNKKKRKLWWRKK